MIKPTLTVKPLNATQRRTLVFVEAYYHEHGYPPALREIAAGVGMRSISGVSRNLMCLTGNGLLERKQLGGRCYFPTRGAHDG